MRAEVEPAARPDDDVYGSAAHPGGSAELQAEPQPEGLQRLHRLAEPFRDDGAPAAPSAAELKQRLAALDLPARFTSREAAAALGHASWAPALEALGVTPGEGRHFLLAARLALFMERSFAGATLDELGPLFLSATPGARDTFGPLGGDDLRALQRIYPFMPQWSKAPGPRQHADDWFGAPTTQNLYAERFEHALGELNQISFDMPVTRTVGERLAQTRPFAKANVVMVQHVLGQASGFMNAMVAAGLDPKKAEMVGIPYQGGQAVKVAVEGQTGVPLDTPEVGDLEGMWSQIGSAIDRAVERHRVNGEPILVLDDGGYASKYIVEKYPELQSAFRVVEQTTRGLTELSALDLEFPVVNVAGSYGKRLESTEIGDAIVSSVSRVLQSLSTSLHHRDVLVLGAGKVGHSTAEAARRHGAGRVAVYDPYLAPRDRERLEAEGFKVITDKAEALAGRYLVIGTSGHQSIDLEDFEKLASTDAERPVFIASGSSKRVEVDHVGLLSQATDAEGRLRRVLASTVNDQQTYHYWLKDGRMLTALANNLPVNFQDINSVPPSEIDHVMALMIAGAAQALATTAPGLQPLDEGVQFEIQAQDAKLERRAPRDGERGFTVAGVDYAGTLEQWAGIATSVGTPPVTLKAMWTSLSDAAPGTPEFQLALDCLSAPHELSDALIDQVLENAVDQLDQDEQQQVASHALVSVTRLMKNDALTDEQAMRVSAFVQARLDFILERGRHGITSGKVPRSKYRHVPHDASLAEAVRAGSLPRLSRTTLLVKNALTDPRVPPQRLAGFLTEPSLLQNPTPAGVFAVQNPRWSSEELERLAAPAFERSELMLGTPTYARYLFDLSQAFEQHPNASERLRAQMLELQQLLRLADPGTPLGQKLWPDVIGEPLPVYRRTPATVERLAQLVARRPGHDSPPVQAGIERFRQLLNGVRDGRPLEVLKAELLDEVRAARLAEEEHE
ncbi:MAG: hypothetical protein IPJ65_05695 [Archangiaceae bacterium]|nr:hypothetical protein [Archangiaceae bacterium]